MGKKTEVQVVKVIFVLVQVFVVFASVWMIVSGSISFAYLESQMEKSNMNVYHPERPRYINYGERFIFASTLFVFLSLLSRFSFVLLAYLD